MILEPIHLKNPDIMIKSNNLFVILIVLLALISCSSVNKRPLYFTFDYATRKLSIASADWGRNLIKIETKTKNDILVLYVSQKPFYLTTNKANQYTIKSIHIDSTINCIQYRDSIYVHSNFKVPR